VTGRRPNTPAHEAVNDLVTHTINARQLWRQVGWHGQSGDFYALNEEPTLGVEEKASYRPLWILVDNDPVDGQAAEDYANEQREDTP
jgi:hypothetical protein